MWRLPEETTSKAISAHLIYPSSSPADWGPLDERSARALREDGWRALKPTEIQMDDGLYFGECQLQIHFFREGGSSRLQRFRIANLQTRKQAVCFCVFFDLELS